jgi:2-methylcitrate dehydratase
MTYTVEALADWVLSAEVGNLSGESANLLRRNFEAAPTRPFSWESTVEKFPRLARRHADAPLRADIIAAITSLRALPVTALSQLLVTVDEEASL